MDFNQEIMEMAEKIAQASLVQIDDIPKIDLYMEQVLSFLEQEMGDSLRQKDETVFTKTMVNNYTKEGILPRPQKKKYNKSHIIMLTYIFILKQILSIQDIKAFFALMDDKEQLEPLYRIFLESVHDYQEEYSAFVSHQLERIGEKFKENGLHDEKMKKMAFISLMSLAAMSNKMICSMLLDHSVLKEDEQQIKQPQTSNNEIF